MLNYFKNYCIYLKDDLNTEAKKNEEIKENLSKEINDLRDQLTSNKTTKMPSTKNEEKDAETEKVNEKDQKNDPKTTTLETITE